MMSEKNLPTLQQREGVAPKRFDPRSATPFVNKSVSEETRRAYRRAVADFFHFIGGKQAFATSQEEKILPLDCKLRRIKYLNNIIEQDHRFIKKKVRASQCFKRFYTAERTLEGIET